ncbi:MAG: M20/M25/M40 family metallo-hydrolase [Clostridia bacterium]|nr:M20/M25/M40 family metallo-hydrolase [Clostridia bacterium]
MQAETISLLKQLCAIPAPSHHEERRAAFIRGWFEANGMHAVIDDALNVLCPVGLDEHKDMIVVAAHTDTVFPDMEPMPMREEGGRLYCPGVGDDTANVAALMMLARYLRDRKPSCGILFAANSCEEGLGNLKGCKAIMKAYAPRVKAFVSLDCGLDGICCSAVGSSRYRITAKTKGGHSFSDFGSRNAIEALAQLITKLYQQEIPHHGASITTYNVGMIEGGTSVNTIAQQAQMLYEYRSDDASCLAQMEKQMQQILGQVMGGDVQYEVELLGTRPCADGVDPQAHQALIDLAAGALRRYTDHEPALGCGSTDCNIPLSLGIPSVCYGVYRGAGEHTREEWMEPASMKYGMKAALCMLLHWYETV